MKKFKVLKVLHAWWVCLKWVLGMMLYCYCLVQNYVLVAWGVNSD